MRRRTTPVVLPVTAALIVSGSILITAYRADLP